MPAVPLPSFQFKLNQHACLYPIEDVVQLYTAIYIRTQLIFIRKIISKTKTRENYAELFYQISQISRRPRYSSIRLFVAAVTSDGKLFKSNHC